MQDAAAVIAATQTWVSNMVVGLNLCPFSHYVVENNQLRYSVTETQDKQQLMNELIHELQWLENHPEIETTLLIHPGVLNHFDDYLNFLDVVNQSLPLMDYEGIFQVASFHPDYQFGGTGIDDVENFTNRSPYPMLHILREASVEHAIANFQGDIDAIPDRNIERLTSMGRDAVLALAMGSTKQHKQ